MTCIFLRLGVMMLALYLEPTANWKNRQFFAERSGWVRGVGWVGGVVEKI